MPVLIPSFFLPKNGATWYLVEDTYIRGGLRVVPDHDARSTIHPANLKSGMIVVTANDNKLWQLGNDLDSWTELRFPSVDSNAVVYTHKQLAPSNVWTINHGKNMKYFSYTSFESTGKQVIPDDMNIINYTKAELTFTTPISGHCTLVFDATA